MRDEDKTQTQGDTCLMGQTERRVGGGVAGAVAAVTVAAESEHRCDVNGRAPDLGAKIDQRTLEQRNGGI